MGWWMGRVLLFGLDGATYKLITPLIENGSLPNIGRFLEEGVSGRILSTLPPLSAPAWTSMVTGRNPGRHGVYDFMTAYTTERGVEVAINDSRSVRGKALWDILGRAGKKVVVQNVPLTYPCYPVNGVMVAGFPSPLKGFNTYPPELASQLEERHKDYTVEITYLKPEYKGLDEDRFVRELELLLEKHYRLTIDLMERFEWDFYILVYGVIDRIQHMMWRYLDPEYSSKDPNAERFKRAIEGLYQRVDRVLGDIMGRLSPEDHIFLVSDHGFEPLRFYVGINNWLLRKGWLKEKLSSRLLGSLNIDELYRALYYQLNRLGLLKLIQLLPTRISIDVLEKAKAFSEKIDFDHSIAYSLHYGGITLNKSYIEERGWETSKVMETIVKELYRLKNPLTGGRLVEKIYRREEVYKGDMVDRAPDLIVVFGGGSEPKRWTKGGVIEANPWIPNQSVVSGAHHSSSANKGIFLALGPWIRRGSWIEAKIEDVAPTILHILDTPIPRDMDGRVLKEIFREGSPPIEKAVRYEGEKERVKRIIREMKRKGRI